MLETFGIVATQVAMLFILIAVGFFLCKKNVLNDTVRKGMTTILIDVITPCVVISEMQTERTAERVTGLLLTAAVFAAYFIVAILLTVPLARRKGQGRSVEATKRICMIYSNCGFMGLPLLASLTDIVGGDALFYGSVIIGVNNLFIFTQGISMFGNADSGLTKKQQALRTLKMILSPAVIAIFIGAALFFSGFALPGVIGKPAEYIASMNTPLAMLVIGAIICRSNVLDVFRDKRIYFPVFVRNVLFPGLFLGIMALCGLTTPEMLICLVIAACPVAGNCAIFSERYGGDSKLASGVFSLSTLFSSISVPFIVTLATTLFAG